MWVNAASQGVSVVAGRTIFSHPPRPYVFPIDFSMRVPVA